MRVFYRGPRAVITADVITVGRSTPHSYPIAELADVYVIRQRRARRPARVRTMGVSALVGGIVVVPTIGRVSVLLAAVVVVTALFVCAMGCLRIAPPAHHELVASYRGQPVLVFASEDQREFDQVCRGFQRAREHQR